MKIPSNTPTKIPPAFAAGGAGHGKLVEAGRVELPSAQALPRHLRAYSAIESRHAVCPRTGERHRQHPVGSRSRPRMPGTGRQPANDARHPPQAEEGRTSRQ